MTTYSIDFSCRDLPVSAGAHALATKNTWHLRSRPVRSELAKRFLRCFELRVRSLQAQGSLPRRLEGCYELRVLAFAPIRIHRDGEWYPRLDADACVVPVRDALESVGLISDDVVLVDGPCATVYRADLPGLHVRLIKVGRMRDRIAWIKAAFDGLDLPSEA